MRGKGREARGEGAHCFPVVVAAVASALVVSSGTAGKAAGGGAWGHRWPAWERYASCCGASPPSHFTVNLLPCALKRPGS